MNIPFPQDIDEILFELKKDIDINPTMSLTDKPSIQQLKRGIEIIPQENQEFVCVGSHGTDVRVGSRFDVIIPRRRPHEYVKCLSIFKYVTVNPSYEIDYLPDGYSGICLLEFPEGKPEILNKLGIAGEKKDFSVHDYLILTQKPILEKVLDKLNNISKEQLYTGKDNAKKYR